MTSIDSVIVPINMLVDLERVRLLLFDLQEEGALTLSPCDLSFISRPLWKLTHTKFMSVSTTKKFAPAEVKYEK